ncbi:alpha/beta fold hydrolase [Demequina sp. SO4-13]|uniref:alpha/beta fold hydrolase n=1 Tax=Demequina sp. SO4-13 TaxID=3401027 RepID=UPI003AF4FCDD
MDPVSVPAKLEWRDDVLPGYEHAPVSGATLVRRRDNPSTPRAIALHVHGYNDHFFQTHLADAFAAAGCAFYAVDMRRAGRSLRPGERAHHIADIAELGADITAAAAAATADAGDLPLVVHAHSTGGLAAAVWADRTPSPNLAGLILNSPLFGLRLPRWKQMAIYGMPTVSRFRAEQVVVPAPSHYTQSLVSAGRWPFDVAWKKPEGQPATAGWLGATLRARQAVARGLDIEVPVLVARSDSCGPDRPDNPRRDSQDVVVDTDKIAAYAKGLGSDVEELVVEGGIHDLSLSADGPREVYLDAVAAFVDRVLR